ncbi:uncharacterized protein M421DRAFT_422511 [Didymella exigua CBS 183.55]|uniref:SCP domain-containing protein n=1 Tax=Didymella exigua CBS 183.55 TaxID=1150837 RepID=A0A6A5RG93_9PLEO|nr:uncharacterized protein M421DRAFT_422511 [Didymella exigua CBS 183.55]KAF1926529.1 hypothetical protein M421DRAFT_422511 [Didymella exigua CBS 183.55]
MRSTTAILALAGSALAAPHWSQPEYKEVQNVHVVYETVVHTVYYTEDQAQAAKPTKASTTPYQTPVVTTTVVYQESTPAPAASTVVVEYSQAPVPTTSEPAATSTAPAPSSTASGYQAIVDTWRAKMGLKALTNDAKLESNAMDTVVSSNGQMVHKLNPGSYGQVLAPGNADDFEHVFVGGWLCEIPTLPGLDGVCATQSEGWAYAGQTGHAEILTSDNYSKIGCALYAGIWCCDLA